jgi:predicted ester cyclase
MSRDAPSPAEVVKNVIDLVNAGDLDAAETFIAPDAVNHAAAPGAQPGTAAFRQGWEALRKAFPNWTFTIEHSITDGDVVSNRYLNRGTQDGEFAGRPATGRSCTALGLDMVRVRGGKVVEHWALLDLAAMGEQLGWDG